MKISARKRFSLCFRPVAMDKDLTSDGKSGSGDQAVAYVNVADNEGLMIPPLPEKESSNFSAPERVSRRPRKGVRRIFSAMFNSIFFDTKLVQRRELRNRKVRQDPYFSDCNQSAKSEKLSYFDDQNIDSSVSPSSPFSSSSSPISRLSTSRDFYQNSKCLDAKQNDRSVESIKSSNLQEARQKTKKEKNVGIGRYSSSYGLLLLLITFSIMIFWGRLYAILCTSICLYLAPRLYIKSHLSEVEQRVIKQLKKSN